MNADRESPPHTNFKVSFLHRFREKGSIFRSECVDIDNSFNFNKMDMQYIQRGSPSGRLQREQFVRIDNIMAPIGSKVLAPLHAGEVEGVTEW